MSKKDKAQRKKKKRQERLRKEKHARRFTAAPASEDPAWMKEPADADDIDDWDDDEDWDEDDWDGDVDFEVERSLRKIQRVMKENNFTNPDDAYALMHACASGGKLFKVNDPKEDAQELAFQSIESEDPKESRELAEEALKLDPGCVDALNQIALFEGEDDLDKQTKLLGQVVETGRRALGEAFFSENKGVFWLKIDTRPFMRALDVLGHLHFFAGRYSQAAALFKEMLELNTEDDQRARYHLLWSALAGGDTELARRVLDQYKEEHTSFMEWTRVLERLVSNDMDGAYQALRPARKLDSLMGPTLLDFNKHESDLKKYDSATLHTYTGHFILLSLAWSSHKSALVWLTHQHKSEQMTLWNRDIQNE